MAEQIKKRMASTVLLLKQELPEKSSNEAMTLGPYEACKMSKIKYLGTLETDFIKAASSSFGESIDIRWHEHTTHCCSPHATSRRYASHAGRVYHLELSHPLCQGAICRSGLERTPRCTSAAVTRELNAGGGAFSMTGESKPFSARWRGMKEG